MEVSCNMVLKLETWTASKSSAKFFKSSWLAGNPWAIFKKFKFERECRVDCLGLYVCACVWERPTRWDPGSEEKAETSSSEKNYLKSREWLKEEIKGEWSAMEQALQDSSTCLWPITSVVLGSGERLAMEQGLLYHKMLPLPILTLCGDIFQGLFHCKTAPAFHACDHAEIVEPLNLFFSLLNWPLCHNRLFTAALEQEWLIVFSRDLRPFGRMILFCLAIREQIRVDWIPVYWLQTSQVCLVNQLSVHMAIDIH